ncbi:MAG: ATP synthase subunit I [Acidobacteriales bacterium]|nr:ATP synthase subunit I [Terriglobales bacterium]
MSAAFDQGSASEAFLNRAYPRIIRISTILGVMGSVIALAAYGVAAAAGFVAGAAASVLNFVWLHRGVAVLVDRMLSQGEAGARSRVLLSLFLRYALVALIAYVIFKSSARAMGAFLIALPLPILAAMCEAAYEAFVNVKDPGSTDI